MRAAVSKKFDQRWRRYLERVSEKSQESITKTAERIIKDIQDILDDTAPYTQGTLLGKQTPYSGGVRVQKPKVPRSKQGFKKFRKQSSGKRTFIITNAVWSEYGSRLESGELQHNPELGGRPFDPGFVMRAITVAKERANARLR